MVVVFWTKIFAASYSIRLQADRIKLEEKRKGKEHELHDLQKDRKTRIDAAQQAVESTTKAFTATADLMKKKCSEIIEKIQAQEKADLDRLNGLQEQLELEIAILRGHEDDLDKLLQTADNIHFLQNFEKMPTSSGAEDFPTHSLETAFSFGDIRNILSEFKDSLEFFCKKEVEKILERAMHAVDGKQVTVDFPECSGWRGIVPEMEVVPYAASGSSSANCSFDIGCKVRVKPSVVTPKYQWGAMKGEDITVNFPEQKRWLGVLSEVEFAASAN
ncbi:hypothetical protein P4O66_001088 [Electrophorus voltai]|uniref:TRIM8/14/16/25/29/45/65 coiled-coil region domain-containing protein n=1 Tax=Electrophorus voltai TaxID=2609070 RepID=A0AAD8ZCN6_9TELE|nr:hypothetical protein P4O66_001088 [Electrophorus voltai]